MNRERIHLSLHELDPADGDGIPGRDAVAALYLAAYAERFPLRATPGRVRPYSERYDHYGIVAPWVRRYLRRQPAAHPLADLARDPLDPFVDWRALTRWGALRLWRAWRARRRPGGDSTCS